MALLMRLLCFASYERLIEEVIDCFIVWIVYLQIELCRSDRKTLSTVRS